MNDLMRDLAPLCTEAWKEIEEEARNALTVTLAARKIADFKGPLGWDASAVPLGRVEPLSTSPGPDVEASARLVQPLVELCVPFKLARPEMDAIARGAADADLDPVNEAARKIAMAEDRLVFHGFPAAGVTGLMEAAKDHALDLPNDASAFPTVLARGLSKLRENGVDGPYGLVLGAKWHTMLMETTTSAGYPVLQHVRRLIDGPLVWAPGIDGAALVSLRGGDFELSVGRDLSIGYKGHDDASVRLYLQESVTFRCLGPEAAVPLIG